MFRSLCSVSCLCVNVYCTAATQLQLYTSYHIIYPLQYVLVNPGVLLGVGLLSCTALSNIPSITRSFKNDHVFSCSENGNTGSNPSQDMGLYKRFTLSALTLRRADPQSRFRSGIYRVTEKSLCT
jgi:hypothetical protein